MLNLTDDLVERLTLLARAMAHLSGRKITRNMLIIDALEVWVAECTEQGLLPKMEITASGCAEKAPDHETSYTLDTPSWLFRGKKPAAVIFDGNRMPVTTWREVHTQILRHCGREKHGELLRLRNKIAGRKRVFLSDKPDGMDVPIKITDAIYAESYFDTEYLVRTLKQILDAAGCDHSGIFIAIKEAKGDAGAGSRIETLCRQRIVGERDLAEQPITPQEVLDCLLLTAALDRKHAGQIKQAIQAKAFCAPETTDICKKTLSELRRLPEFLRQNTDQLTDRLDLDDRLPEMEAARQALRAAAAANPAQAEYLNTAADILEEWWTPLTLDE